MNLTLNNNAYYYGTDVTTQGVGQGGNIVGTFLITLAQLQAYSMPLSAAGTNDNASIAFNTAVPFISADDLHITCGSAVDNAGVPIAGITTDIDGNMRSATTPDIGADETQAPTAVSAVSRKTHGAAGDFDIDLPSSGPIGIECRSGGLTNDYQDRGHLRLARDLGQRGTDCRHRLGGDGDGQREHDHGGSHRRGQRAVYHRRAQLCE